jgi:uncharacterized Tic20 family protein
MTTNPSQPTPERRASGPASSEPLDALPAPGERFAPANQRPGSVSRDRWPAQEGPAKGPGPGKPAAATGRDKPAAAPDPAKPATAPERAHGGQTQVITRERAEPLTEPADGPAADLNDHRLAMLSYLGVPFLGPVIPLVIYLTKKRASAFVRYHSAQALNLSITALLYTICILILGTILSLDSIVFALIVGVTLAVALWLATLVYVIRTGSRANRGSYYRIPGWLCATMVR